MGQRDPMAAELNPQWLGRLNAVGRAQSRYLWILLVAMLFYVGLRFRVASSPSDTSLTVPLLGVQLSGAVILSSGPTVLSFLVLAILGTMRAYRRAREQLGLSAGADWSGEELDLYPNAIDLALYTTPRSPKIIAAVTHFGYAFFLLVGLVEAAWLGWYLVNGAAAWYVFAVVLGAMLWLPAFWLVVCLWCRRIHQVPTLRRTR